MSPGLPHSPATASHCVETDPISLGQFSVGKRLAGGDADKSGDTGNTRTVCRETRLQVPLCKSATRDVRSSGGFFAIKEKCMLGERLRLF